MTLIVGSGMDVMKMMLIMISVLVAAGDGTVVEWAGDDDDGVGDDDDDCGGDGQYDSNRTSNKANMKLHVPNYM